MHQKTMLRVMCAYPHSPGVAFAKIYIDIADRRVERTRMRVRRRCSIFGAAAREKQQVGRPLLKSRRTIIEQKNGTCGPITDQANTGPNVTGLRQTKAA